MSAFALRYTSRDVLIVNGTAALHVALKLAGVCPGDEVLLPALTFVATANAVAYCAATPHFVDSAIDTLGLDPQALRAYLSRVAELRGGPLVCLDRQGLFLRPLDSAALQPGVDHLAELRPRALTSWPCERSQPTGPALRWLDP